MVEMMAEERDFPEPLPGDFMNEWRRLRLYGADRDRRHFATYLGISYERLVKTEEVRRGSDPASWSYRDFGQMHIDRIEDEVKKTLIMGTIHGSQLKADLAEWVPKMRRSLEYLPDYRKWYARRVGQVPQDNGHEVVPVVVDLRGRPGLRGKQITFAITVLIVATLCVLPVVFFAIPIPIREAAGGPGGVPTYGDQFVFRVQRSLAKFLISPRVTFDPPEAGQGTLVHVLATVRQVHPKQTFRLSLPVNCTYDDGVQLCSGGSVDLNGQIWAEGTWDTTNIGPGVYDIGLDVFVKDGGAVYWLNHSEIPFTIR